MMSALTIQIPDSLHEKLREQASKDHSTPEQVVVLAIAEKLSSLLTIDYLNERARRAKSGDLKRLLAKVPDAKPEECDSI